MVDNTIPVTPGTGASVRTLTNAAIDGGAHQQVMSLADSAGAFIGVNGNPLLVRDITSPMDPDGTPQVSTDPSSLFLDAFDSGLSNWTTGGIPPTVANGRVALYVTTLASANYMRTVGTFALRSGAPLRYSALIRFEAAAIVNSTRWWGIGLNQTAPTYTAPVLTGAVFTLDYASGALQAAIYSAGTKTVVATLTRPTDALFHKYEIWFRQSVTYFVIDGLVVATANLPTIAQANNLALIFGGTNSSTTAPTTAPILEMSSAGVVDTSGSMKTLGDGVNPWIQATVTSGPSLPSSTATTAKNALVVHSYPTTSMMVTQLGAVNTLNTLTLPTPATGLFHYITGLWIERYISVATTAAASGFVTTAVNTNLIFQLPSDARTIGSVDYPVAINFNSPIPSLNSGVTTSFSTPAVAGTIYRISVTYFVAP